MRKETESNLARLATGGIEECLKKMNSVSAGLWRLGSLRIFPGCVADALGGRAAGAEAIRITVNSVPPMITLLLFHQGDASQLYRGFVGDQFYKVLGSAKQGTALLELGNVLLNAIANSLLKAFKKSAIPSVPELVAAEPEAVMAPHQPTAGAVYTIISATLSLRYGDHASGAEVVAIVPDSLAADSGGAAT